jgi:TAT (twin-arginine translocation) pathway signal sequence
MLSEIEQGATHVRTAPAEISRRQFLAAGGVTVAAACLVPRGLCAQTDDLVEHALKEATTAKVTVQTLRRNISVLYGAGGNVAVLIGLTESCSLIQKSSARVLTFPPLL